MTLAPIDWCVIAVVLAAMAASVLMSRGQMRSVADFLAAGRGAGRYLVSVSEGAAGLGAISVVGFFEMYYASGFSMMWWGLSTNLVLLLISLSGWVIYRFRQTRCLTLAEFFERRYSRRFRVFAGSIAFGAGLVNFGIFPAVGARFFITFCGLPETVTLGPIEVSSFVLTMAVLLSIALWFVFMGGQVAVIVADFLQGTFVNVVMVVLVAYLLSRVEWAQLVEGVAAAPENASLINPFRTRHVADFNFAYFLIGVFGVIYNKMSWQGTQAYNASASSAHESKMGGILANWRVVPQNLMLVIVPVIAYAVLHQRDFTANAVVVNGILDAVESEPIRSQLRVPLVLTTLLPPGLMGAVAAVMLAAFISTHDTYLHSWGSIFIQDVVMPLRRKPLTPSQHLRLLRTAIVGVAVFAFVFSLVFRQSQYIFLFFAVTGAIFAGGSGAVIIGGLYWRRGTTAAAWAAMSTGSVIAVGGIVVHQLVADFPINGQWFWGLAMLGASVVYVIVSLLDRRPAVDLDRLLYRSEAGTVATPSRAGSGPWRALGMGREFSRGDRVVYVGTALWIIGWSVVFFWGTAYNLSHDVPDASWVRFWRIYTIVHLIASVGVIVWFTWGGVRNVVSLRRTLTGSARDHGDDGWVQKR